MSTKQNRDNIQEVDYFNQTSDRLTYRPLTESDTDSWIAFFSENPALPYLGIDLSKDVETLARDWVLKQLERYKEQGLGHLAVIEKESGHFIGMGGILPRVINEVAVHEIAYSLKPPYWGKGYATEIARQMKWFGESRNIAPNFISIIHVDNSASMAVARKNGMKQLYKMNYLGMDVKVFGTK